MKRIKLYGFIGGILGLVMSGCGGSGGIIPDVAGLYICESGCDGPDCVFDDQLTVTQQGDSVVINSQNFTDASGDVDENGNFTASNPDINCTGQFAGGTAVANCTANGVACQQVTFQRQ